MKRTLILFIAIICTIDCYSQDDFKYRRSSLHTMMVDNPQIVVADNFSLNIGAITRASFTDAPFPSKYDDHNISTETQSFKFVTLTGQEEDEDEENKERVIGPNGKELSAKDSDNINQIQDYLKKNKIANKMVGKWFNQTPEGNMDQNLIIERGWNNATDEDLEDAKALSKSANTLIANAGYELIGNTFLVVNQYKFVDNEFVARPLYEIAKGAAMGIENEMARNIALKVAEKAYQKAQGYTIRTKAYLFQLVWNDSISKGFYSSLLPIGKTGDELAAAKNAFDNSELFHFEFVGVEKSLNTITSKLDPAKAQSDEQKIQEATVRAVDRTYAKLQKNYDVFKPLSALILADGKPKECSAKIGMKEGIEGGEKFDVLKPSFNRKTGASEFKKVATITVDKKNVWDNQYIAGQGPKIEDGEITIQATKFKGCKKNLADFYPYIRLTK